MRCFGAVARALACRYEWEKDGFGDLLMMALPHHVDTMVGASGQDAAFVMNDSYQCIKVREGRARLEEPLDDIQRGMREYHSVYCFKHYPTILYFQLVLPQRALVQFLRGYLECLAWRVRNIIRSCFSRTVEAMLALLWRNNTA